MVQVDSKYCNNKQGDPWIFFSLLKLRIQFSDLSLYIRSFRSDSTGYFVAARWNLTREVAEKLGLSAHFRRRNTHLAAGLFSGTCESCRAACVVTTRDSQGMRKAPSRSRSSVLVGLVWSGLVDDMTPTCFHLPSCWVPQFFFP
jgi:hypothetical protein